MRLPDVDAQGVAGSGDIVRIAVVGSRKYPNMEEVARFVFEQERDTVIISGGAQGVDTVAVAAARRLRMPYEVYPADWTRHGRKAGALRNRTIVEKSDQVVAFWDGQSTGTPITIRLAMAAGKPCRVFKCSPSAVPPEPGERT